MFTMQPVVLPRFIILFLEVVSNSGRLLSARYTGQDMRRIYLI